MPDLVIADEAIASLWDGLAKDLDALAPSRADADRFLLVARDHLLRMLSDAPEDVFEAVVTSEPGASSGVLQLRISGRVYGQLALAAKRFHGIRNN